MLKEGDKAPTFNLDSDTGGRVLGRVTAVDGPMERSWLVVDGGRGEILIPLAADICVQIDPQTARIVVSPPEGLIELNAPRSERL